MSCVLYLFALPAMDAVPACDKLGMLDSLIHLCTFPDVCPPWISGVTFNDQRTGRLTTRPDSTLRLQFSVNDDRELPQQNPPPNYIVTIGPVGSTPARYESVSTAGGATIQRTYTYSWVVPTNPSFTTIGYSIFVTDSAGNPETLVADAMMRLGMLKELDMLSQTSIMGQLCAFCDFVSPSRILLMFLSD